MSSSAAALERRFLTDVLSLHQVTLYSGGFSNIPDRQPSPTEVFLEGSKSCPILTLSPVRHWVEVTSEPKIVIPLTISAAFMQALGLNFSLTVDIVTKGRSSTRVVEWSPKLYTSDHSIKLPKETQ